jgi:transposase
MAVEGNKSVAQVARDLDIKVNTLYNWVDQHRKSHPHQFLTRNENTQPLNLESENKRLKKKLADSQRDVELLKKRRCTLRHTASEVHLDKATY